MKKDIYEKLAKAVFSLNLSLTERISQEIVKNNLDCQKAIFQGLVLGIKKVSDYFARGKYFIPEVLVAAECFYKGFEILKTNLKNPLPNKGKILLAVVEGDIHDIGKNIVKLMAEMDGFQVIDLGRDCPKEKILETAVKEKPEIIGLSALMTTTMLEMEKVIKLLKENNIKAKVVIGGAPTSQLFAQKIGADGYAPDAVSGIKLFNQLIND
ncbi:MAG: corrinoid protein [candidate division WOR-3 bacterium]